MKILLADDHALIREGLERNLVSLDEDMSFIHASDRDSVLAQLEANRDTDVILLDLFMPGANGFELLSALCDQYSDIPVIVISGTEDPRYMKKCIDYGASGFIPKSTNVDIMMSAITLVLRGGVYLPADILRQTTTAAPDNNAPFPSRQDPAGDSSTMLTIRQREVLQLMARGMSNKMIGRTLEVSEHTIKVHVAAILKLLKVTNRTEAVMMAKNAGMIDD
jgi:DNA-binding NarL/FixJ family response regulator